MNGEAAKVSYRLRGGEQISLDWEPSGPLRALPEDIPLEVIYEDDELVAVNKPAGMVVHPGAGRLSGTLINALLHRFEALSQLGGESRPGIVHRLDRQTSGVLLVAKNDVVVNDFQRDIFGQGAEGDRGFWTGRPRCSTLSL